MVKTQVQLTKEQYTVLKELSKKNKESIATLIRKAVDQFLLNRRSDRASLYRQALSVVGKYEAGPLFVNIVAVAHIQSDNTTCRRAHM